MIKERIKGFIAGVAAVSVLYGSVVSADSMKKTIEVVFNDVILKVNGQKVNVDNISYKGTTYAPIRAVAEMLGKKVTWDQTTRTASIDDWAYTVAPRTLGATTMKWDSWRILRRMAMDMSTTP